MKLSVIVPVYNGESTIEKCLLSIIGQDYPDIEIVVVNDGSTDKSKSIVERIIHDNSDSNIKLINKQNQGLPQARKTGVENSSGEYIGFVDADDWIEPDMYSVMMNKASEQDSDIVCCDFIYVFPTSTDNHIQKYVSDTPISGRAALLLLNNRRAVFQYCWNKIVKKELYRFIEFPRNNLIGEDYTISRQLLLNASNVSIVNHLGYHYVQYNGSMAHNGYDDSQRNGFFNYRKILDETYRTKDEELIYSTDNYIINEFLWIVISMAENRKYDQGIIKWIKKYIIKRVVKIFRNENNSLLYKFSCIVFLLNSRLLGCLFLAYNKFKNNM